MFVDLLSNFFSWIGSKLDKILRQIFTPVLLWCFFSSLACVYLKHDSLIILKWNFFLFFRFGDWFLYQFELQRLYHRCDLSAIISRKLHMSYSLNVLLEYTWKHAEEKLGLAKISICAKIEEKIQKNASAWQIVEHVASKFWIQHQL